MKMKGTKITETILKKKKAQVEGMGNLISKFLTLL
jgi:hypothetical protein